MSVVSNSIRIAVAIAGVASLSGCLGAPTYGTGTSSTAQLVEDLGESVMLINPQKKDNITYEPRPELVRPTSTTRTGSLAPPQKSLASVDNPNWVESPEQQRDRVYAEIEANKDNPTYRSELTTADNNSRKAQQQQLDAFRDARKQATTIDISQRRYLIDPPDEYRAASSPEALNDLGQSERVKESRRKKLAEGKDPDKCFLFLNCNRKSTALIETK